MEIKTSTFKQGYNYKINIYNICIDMYCMGTSGIHVHVHVHLKQNVIHVG